MQYRKPGLSLSNRLHLSPSGNSGAGPEGMNGKEGPVHRKEATWGGPAEQSWASTFPFEGYPGSGGHPGLSPTINTTLPEGITWASLPLADSPQPG